MDYVAHLEEMLKVLGCYRPPVYVSRDHAVNSVTQGVIYTLTVTNEDEPIRSFSFATRRESSEEAIQETARLAVLHLARVHATELAGTVYRLYPAASGTGAAPRLQLPLVEGEEDATAAQMARLALAQACFADRAAAELGRTQVALDAAQERIADLERAQASLDAARKRITELSRAHAERKRMSELRSAQADELKEARKRIAQLRSELDAARKRIADLEEAFFQDSPDEEDLTAEEEVPVQDLTVQPEEADAHSEAPAQSEPVQEDPDEVLQAAAALVSAPTLYYTRRRGRGGK